ncbi:unnamed protein product [Scytosiphon promiscuus]
MAGWFSSINLDQIGAQVTGLTQSLGESAAKMGEDLQQTVNSLAAFDLEDIGKAIEDAEQDITSEETKIQRAETAGLKQTEVKILPWETRIEKLAILSPGLMEKILSLSLEESNFTTPPLQSGAKPEGSRVESPRRKGDADDERNSSLPFQLDRHIKVAVKMLSLDPNLAKVHARLISHMPEKTFWYHYFSRVSALREELNLEPLCEDLSKETSGTTTSEEYDKVSHGDAQSMPSPSDRGSETNMKSNDGKGLDKNDGGGDIDDDDYSDLGDLDDLDGDSDSSIDAALEAEIAAELGEG